MRTLIVLESAEELIAAARRTGLEYDGKTVHLPPDAQFVFDNDWESVSLKATGFELSGAVTVGDVVVALATEIGLRVHVT